MAQSRPVIITCALTGAIHTPSMSPYLPVTPEEIINDAVAASEAGASILHLHARDPETGKPDQTPEAFARFLPAIHQRCDAIINLTTGGSPFMTVIERVKPAALFKPEIASLNMGSMNMGLFPMLDRFTTFRHTWEREHLAHSDDLVFRNSFKDIALVLQACNDAGTRFEFECYDTAHLYNLAHFADRRAVEPPFFIQTVFGILGGIGTHPDDLAHMHRTADRLFGTDYAWSVLGAGKAQMPVASISAASGGHVRVGLEDSLWAWPGTLAEGNAVQVAQVRQIIEGLGHRVATPDEARSILALKGRDAVAIGSSDAIRGAA
ncbi:MAG: 3-keto-5-aminohexanoate cleavage protein [Pseudomonadota bacterium]